MSVVSAPSSTAAAPAAPQLALRGLAVAGWIVALFVVNHVLLRFLIPSDPFAAVTPAAVVANDAAAFAAHWPWFLLLVAATAAACALAAPALRAVWGVKVLPGLPRAVALFLAACALAAVASFIVSLCLGVGTTGGSDQIFFWGGLGFVWLGFVAMAAIAIRYRDGAQLVDWLLHNIGLLLLPLTVYPQVPFWMAFEFSLSEALMTAFTLAATGNIFMSYFLALRLRAAGRRG